MTHPLIAAALALALVLGAAGALMGAAALAVSLLRRPKES
jgi:hypothetical protein